MLRKKVLQTLAHAGLLGALLTAAHSASAGPIVFDTFLQFSFDGAGASAQGCDPADPAGGFCISSSGTPTQFLDAPAWTFNAPVGGATLTVVDAFTSGDRFNVYDSGVLIGSTTAGAVRPPVDCGDDPVTCLATFGMDQGSFTLAAGQHSLSLVAAQAPGGLGSGYLRVSAVPEPATLALMAGGLLGLMGLSARRKGRVSGNVSDQGAAA
jgi:PEP-CTERM motif